MRIDEKYVQGHRNLREQYRRIQDEIKKISFPDSTLEAIRIKIADFTLPESDNILANLRYIQKEIKPKIDEFEARMRIFKDDFYGDKPLSIELTNAGTSELMLCGLRFGLGKIIRDIKLECLMGDKDEILFEIVDKTNIDDKENDNTLLLEATSLPLVPKKIIGGLLELGADPFIKCRFNETPFSKAISEDNLEVAKLYLGYKIRDLEEKSDAIMLNPLRKLLEVPNAKIFYEELAKNLQDKAITDILGIDPDATQECLVQIGESYEGLGYDSSILGDDSEEDSIHLDKKPHNIGMLQYLSGQREKLLDALDNINDNEALIQIKANIQQTQFSLDISDRENYKHLEIFKTALKQLNTIRWEADVSKKLDVIYSIVDSCLEDVCSFLSGSIEYNVLTKEV